MSEITETVSDVTRHDVDNIMKQNNFIYDTKDFEDRFKRFTGANYCCLLYTSDAADDA